MSTFRTFLVAVLLLTLAGCGSSGPATSSSPDADGTTTQTDPQSTTQAEGDSEAESGQQSEPSSADDRATGRDSDDEQADNEQAVDAPADVAAASAPQDWFHQEATDGQAPGLGTKKAYETILAGRSPKQTVTVAILDSGVDVEHEDLQGNIWVNDDETPGNGVDDDGNGYVDDVHGWNFIGGADGENVEHDTYEVTRLYVKLRDRFAGVDSADVAPDNREDYQRFQKVKADFQQQRQETKQEIQYVRNANDAVQFSQSLLKQHLGTDTLTQEKVASVSSPKKQVQQARDILTYFYQQNISPEDLQEYYTHLEEKLEYNLNPNFDPRSIVGDDYDDKDERYYGNNDVTGPDAEHGTHVAGIVAAMRNNGLGMDGVASGVRIMSVRTVPNGDERDKDVANAIRYAVNNGADVINMSFGKSYSPHKEVVDEAVAYATSKGVLLVHAAGNDGADVDSLANQNYPTRHLESGGTAELWIEVGASSWQGGEQLPASFSNYGDETVDVFAPGTAIYSTVPGNAYERIDGTSMAAPMVTGLAALLMAHYPDLSAQQVRTIILDSAIRYGDRTVVRPGSQDAVPFSALSRTGAIVNAYTALQQAE